MTAEDPRVERLLNELLDSHQTPEQVCAESPELLPTVRKRWRKLKRLGVDLDSLFPVQGDQQAAGQELPKIPGYEVEAVLGRGGIGIIYRVRHVKLNRAVALKMLLSGEYAGAMELARFKREAQAIAALQHPNIVQIYDVGEVDGRAYFTMELVDGGSLNQKIASTPQPARYCSSVTETLARAIHVAHLAGIVHRDLKPSNVLLTPDGTPKISDFGLARFSQGQADITLDVARIGTPSYMAPEQVQGKPGTLGPLTDVYALGATLYELLTGRPPFRAESAMETQRQVLTEEPAAPSKLNAKVPQDLETICLKCLQKEPHRRYASAAALADDLRRFAERRPIQARPVGRVERVTKWVHRRPALAALLLVGIAVSLGLAITSLRFVADRAARKHAVEQDLREISADNAASRWADARAAVERATYDLGDQSPADLRARVSKARREADYVRQIEDIRSERALTASPYQPGYDQEASKRYAAIFSGLQLGKVNDDSDAVAARIATSDIRHALLAATYDWMAAVDASQANWLLKVAQRADPDPSGWRERALDPATWRNDAQAAAVTSDPALGQQSVELLFAVRQRMLSAYRDTVPFLVRVQQTHPDNYWANFQVVHAMLDTKDFASALPYAQVAMALRPRAAMAHHFLGQCFLGLDRIDDASYEFREASRCDPDSAFYRGYIGVALARAGQHEKAIVELDSTSPKWDKSMDFLSPLCDSLETLERFSEITERYRTAMERIPPQIWWEAKLRNALVRHGKLDDVLAIWRTTLDSDDEKDCAGYPEFCLFQGREAEYRDACRVLLGRYWNTIDPRICEHVARTCLLAQPSATDLERATAMIDRALAYEQRAETFLYPYSRTVKGLAEYRAGHDQAAIDIMEGDAAKASGPTAKLVSAMAHWRLGEKAGARHALAQAVMSYDWSLPFVEMSERWQSPPLRRNEASKGELAEGWIYHVLRREAESMILPDLPAFLEGRYQPREIDEKLAMTAACDFRERYTAHARLWADAFSSGPSAAYPGRQWAVRAVILAGCGQGKDADSLTDTDRTRFRAQAREWMQAELDALDACLGAPLEKSGAALVQHREMIRFWSRSPDLAPVRDEVALSRLSPDERHAWKALWQRAAELERVAKRNSKS